jgi:hypothetical protein
LLQLAMQVFTSPLQRTGCAVADCAAARTPAATAIATIIFRLMIVRLNGWLRRFAA